MEPISIVKYPGGEPLSVEEAASGRYVFAAGRDADTLFAFDLETAEEETVRWADERELGADLARAREVVDALPEDPSADVDEAAERERVERLNARLREFSTEVGIAMDAPEFIEKAHEAGIFDSALLYTRTYYGSPVVGLSTSCTDLRRYLPTGALSARTYGFSAVLFYDQTNYGAAIARRTPTLSLVGTATFAVSPRPILSVLFT
jgi:hypothetical protein